jgi:hypothetical protein
LDQGGDNEKKKNTTKVCGVTDQQHNRTSLIVAANGRRLLREPDVDRMSPCRETVTRKPNINGPASNMMSLPDAPPHSCRNYLDADLQCEGFPNVS